jgi:AmmeMemoRadiSam system protein B
MSTRTAHEPPARPRGEIPWPHGILLEGGPTRPTLLDLYAPDERVDLGAIGMAIYRELLGGAASEDIAARHDGLAPVEVTAFARELEEAGLLGAAARGRRCAEAFAAATRDGALHLDGTRGEWHLADRLLDEASVDEGWGRVHGALIPHGALSATGACAARALGALQRETWPDVFVILGTSHYQDEPAILTLDVETELGRCANDRDLTLRIAEGRPDLARDLPAFLIEHSWQQALPFVQALGRRFDRTVRVVPILMGAMGFDDARALGRLLRRLFYVHRRRACVLASGDLSHLGAEHDARATAGFVGRSVGDVDAALSATEEPLLAAIARRDAGDFTRGVVETSFCATTQVAALLECVPCAGRVVARQSVLGGVAMGAPPARAFAEEDSVFHAASVLFAAPPGRAGGRRLCRETHWDIGDGVVRLLHRCDSGSFELPAEFAPVVAELVAGARDAAELGARLRVGHGIDCAAADLEAALEALDAGDLFHDAPVASPEPSAFLERRLRAAVAELRETIPAYADLRPGRPDELALLHRERVAREWASFTPPDLRLAGRRRSGDGLEVAYSGGSGGGRPLRCVVELDVDLERLAGGACLDSEAFYTGSDAALPRLVLSRPSNLGLRRPVEGWPAVRWNEAGACLEVAPGPNPTRISARVWARCVERAAAFDPVLLWGEPALLAAFARHCLAHGVRLPRLRRVLLGNYYAWSIDRGVIARAFGVPIVDVLSSGEAGLVAVSCEEGDWHLVETHALFEVLVDGRPARPGETGALVSSNLVSKVWPLLRYVTGDLVRLVAPACRCGRPGRTVRFAGRLADVSAGANGEPVTYADLDAVIGDERAVKFFRLTVAAKTARLEVVPAEDAAPEALRALRDRLADRLARDVALERVASLDIRRRGKLLSVRVDEDPTPWLERWVGRSGRSPTRPEE